MQTLWKRFVRPCKKDAPHTCGRSGCNLVTKKIAFKNSAITCSLWQCFACHLPVFTHICMHFEITNCMPCRPSPSAKWPLCATLATHCITILSIFLAHELTNILFHLSPFACKLYLLFLLRYLSCFSAAHDLNSLKPTHELNWLFLLVVSYFLGAGVK